MTDLAQLELDLINAIGSAETAAAVEDIRVAALGKSGSISGLLKTLGSMSPEERKEAGPAINGLKARVTDALTARRAALKDAIETMGPTPFAHGMMNWTKDNHWGYTLDTGVMLVVKNGDWALAN